jgi:hypothetical protein
MFLIIQEEFDEIYILWEKQWFLDFLLYTYALQICGVTNDIQPDIVEKHFDDVYNVLEDACGVCHENIEKNKW